MKKTILLFLAITTVINVFSESNDFSRWSITTEIGPSIFDGDVSQRRMQLYPTSIQEVAYGATVEYALTQIWGLGVDVYHFPLSGENKDIYFYTPLNTSDIIGTINFSRLIFPQTKSKFAINGSLGFGLAYYMSNFKSPDPVNSPEIAVKGSAVSIPVTFSLEYNISKPWAIGAKIHYRAYNKDNMEGDETYNYKGVTNDYIGSGTLYARYKFNANKKNHLRNIGLEECNYNPCLELLAEKEKTISKLDSVLLAFKNKMDEQDARIDSMAGLLSNEYADKDDDGVPDQRDKELNTPANTEVDFWGKQLKAPNTPAGQTGDTTALEDDIPAVFFDFDKTDFDKDALETIRKIAQKMKADKSLMVEVRGYCDFMGNKKYNSVLSQRRSDKVKAELEKTWGISPERIIPNGKGKVTEPRSKYRPNRRCDFFFSK